MPFGLMNYDVYLLILTPGCQIHEAWVLSGTDRDALHSQTTLLLRKMLDSGITCRAQIWDADGLWETIEQGEAR